MESEKVATSVQKQQQEDLCIALETPRFATCLRRNPFTEHGLQSHRRAARVRKALRHTNQTSSLFSASCKPTKQSYISCI